MVWAAPKYIAVTQGARPPASRQPTTSTALWWGVDVDNQDSFSTEGGNSNHNATYNTRCSSACCPWNAGALSCCQGDGPQLHQSGREVTFANKELASATTGTISGDTRWPGIAVTKSLFTLAY